MNHVLLITTEGCAGCGIMEKFLKSTCEEYNLPLEIVDCTNVDKRILELAEVTDFPTTLIYEDDDIVEKIVGTCTIFYLQSTLTRALNIL